ncbi:MAG: ribonuclease R [Gammaproteobacteria bacterium]|nr:ribonuclease R [Gammaproteobacteria bacterium]
MVQRPRRSESPRKGSGGLPDREALVAFLSAQSRPTSLDAIADDFAAHSTRVRGRLEQRLGAMARDGLVIRNEHGAYSLAKKQAESIEGTVVGHRDGYGFVIPKEGEGDLFLSAREMRVAAHGDRVLAKVSGVDHRGRRQGEIVEVLERANDHVVGRYFRQHGVGVLVPDNQRLFKEVVIPPEAHGDAKEGDIVVAEIIEQPTRRTQPTGRIVEVLGDEMSPAMAIDIAIRSHDIPDGWSDSVLDEVQRVPMQVGDDVAAERVDLRDLPLVTIDGADAKDFDDAVYCEPTGKSWRLWVAIADVSAYVEVDSAIDVEAKERGTSVYFPGRVVPMLPERLSNGICSLNPQVDRLCMACEMIINGQGRIIRSRFVEAVMRSRARLTYDEVSEVLEGRAKNADENHAIAVEPHLRHLEKLHEILASARARRGAIEFDSVETAIIFANDGSVERIEPRERSVSHLIIEECMIAANIAAGRYLGRQRMPALYRVHDSPPATKLTELRDFLRGLGLTLGGGEKPVSADYRALSQAASKRSDSQVIQSVLLRSLPQAVYQPTNAGHFGLALETYCHFTSPIRRYPDLLVHRAIRHRIRGGARETYHYLPSDMASLGGHTSMTERRADEATRDAMAWLKCEFMQDRVGEVLPGVITGVTGFGLFVMLDGLFIDGLVHVSELGGDFYNYEPNDHALVGDRTGRTYQLGDAIRVRVAKVDSDARKVDFTLADPVDDPRPRRKSGRRKGPPKSGRGRNKGHRGG